MRDWLTWFLFDWHWAFVAFCAILLTGAAFLARAGVLYMRVERHEVARFDAYLDDVEDGYIDLPGPGGSSPISGGHDTGPGLIRAGEYHWRTGRCWCDEFHREQGTTYALTERPDRPMAHLDDPRWNGANVHYMDTWLGRPGDGSEHTALRVRREGEAMLARVEAARRELAAECGIRYVPMELVAA